MHLIRFHGLLHSSGGLESHSTYNGRELILQIPALTFKGLRDVGREIITEHRSKIFLSTLSFFLSGLTGSSVLLSSRIHFLKLHKPVTDRKTLNQIY